jgi:hypothetical protein
MRVVRGEARVAAGSSRGSFPQTLTKKRSTKQATSLNKDINNRTSYIHLTYTSETCENLRIDYRRAWRYLMLTTPQNLVQ